MKFESKFGVGEICGYNHETPGATRRMPDTMVKIVAVIFDINGDVGYSVEHVGSHFGVQRFQCGEAMLDGDPDFDQNEGRYLDPDDDLPPF